MADRPKTPMTDTEEGSKGGARSGALFGVVAAALLVLLVLVGMGNFGTKKMAPDTAQQKTKSPATPGSQNP